MFGKVAQLQEWFDTHWNDATEATDAVIETISRHTRRYMPFDEYAKAFQEFFRGHELTRRSGTRTVPGRFRVSSVTSRSEEALPSLTATVEVVAQLQFLEPVARLAVIAERNRPA